MSIFNNLIIAASKLWRILGLGKSSLSRTVDRLTKLPTSYGLSYEYGTLYGWSIYDKLHNPEAETVAFFKKHLKSGDYIADIGANIGYYTLIFSSLVGEKGKVIAFEPEPRTFILLKKATRGIKNVSIIQKGISSKKSNIDIFSNRAGDGFASTVYASGSTRTEIQVIPLREYSETFDWVKIDIEGAELSALQGMGRPTRAVVEVAREIQEKYGGGIKEFLSAIEALGYEIYFIVEAGEIIKYTGNNLETLKSNIYLEPLIKRHELP